MMQYLTQFQREKEERGIVVHRGHVVGVVTGEGEGIVARDQSGKGIVAGLRRQIDGAQCAVFVQMARGRQLLPRAVKALFLASTATGMPSSLSSPWETMMKLFAGFCTPKLMQRLHGDGHHAQGLARLAELPAGNGDQSIGLEVFKVFLEGVFGIKAIFAKAKAPAAVEAQVSTSVICTTSNVW